MTAHDQDLKLHPGLGFGDARVLVPTVEGDRRAPTYATWIGPDPDNPGFVLVYTDRPVMGEHLHSIQTTDITRVPG